MLTVLCRDWIRLRLYYQGDTEEEKEDPEKWCGACHDSSRYAVR
jgi:hypothetical protein